MASPIPPPPPGFTEVVNPPPSASAIPPPPPGFTEPVEAQTPYRGQLLPFSKDADGNVSFDSDAGLLGVVKRTVTFPMDAMQGKVDPKSDEGIARALEAATVLSPVGAGARGGMGWAGAKVGGKTTAKTPTSQELADAADFGYTVAREMGVDYDARAVQNLMLKTRSNLFQDGVIEELAPKSFAILKRLESPPEGSVATIAGLDAARRQLGKAAQDFTNPTEQMAATRIIRALDGFVENPDPQAVVAGPAAAAGGVYKDARGNYAASKRSDNLQGIEDRADLRAKASNSGLNLDNTIRQRVASLLDNPKTRAGFAPEEIKLLEEVVEGTAARNVTRFVGNLLGGGGGLGAVVTGGIGGAAGGAVGGPLGVVAGMATPVIGVGAKVAANRMTGKSLDRVSDVTRQRSPLYKQRVEDAPQTNAANPDLRAIPPRAVGGAVQQQTPQRPLTPEEFEILYRAGYGA